MSIYKMSYAAAARAILQNIDLDVFSWRHHRLGMLQAEFNDELRVHIWHPHLVVPWSNSLRAVHDHRFDLTSCVVWGEIIDVPYSVVEEADEGEWLAEGYELTDMFEIAHAKVQTETSADVKRLGRVWVRSCMRERNIQGAVYSIERRQFHTTIVENLAITVVHRSNFDERPARILGSGDESGIVKPDGTPFVSLTGVYGNVIDAARVALDTIRRA